MTSIPLDKQLHFFAGMAVCAMAAPFGLDVAFMAALVAAVGKEVYDHFFGGTVDAYDVLATALGAGALIAWLTVLSNGFGVVA